MVVFVLIASGFNLVPERIRVGAKQVQKFMVGNLFYVLIAGVGIAMVDFGALLKAFNLMAYAQIATRLGGAIILVLAGFLFSLWLK